MNMKKNVKIRMTRGMPLPMYATPGSAALDLRAALDEGSVLTLQPGERAVVPTGVQIAPEESDTVAIVAARSGLAIRHGITLSNGIGVIDSDYRGEICVGLVNHGQESFTIERGDRIAQLMFLPGYAAALLPTEDLDATNRGAGGFGSTGVK